MGCDCKNMKPFLGSTPRRTERFEHIPNLANLGALTEPKPDQAMVGRFAFDECMALEIGPGSDLDAIWVKSPGLGMVPISVGNGIIGPLRGPVELYAYHFAPAGGVKTGVILDKAFVEVVAHGRTPPSWTQSRAPGRHMRTLALTNDGYTASRNDNAEFPFYGRKRGSLTIRNVGAPTADALVTVKLKTYTNHNNESTDTAMPEALELLIPFEGLATHVRIPIVDEMADTVLVQARLANVANPTSLRIEFESLDY